ncbi:tRNA (adenine(58)-N(1))-methyltransferase non-catalytic subunit TRM6 [Trichinella pseudospiralis]|uniref:tRNA (adenine(58)-N(1))-methyltransferase non-catalytic subunit TRM6 n=2 Tax=Trichinella pseudospiralis TaxID=6337 RepID=A0A0V1FIX0_TRIPS|nr:tRNA (adenine(58)-N(1))-methyltransferase non-catalytic subunit TRM6 [Trichinella pseudospiralis]
MRILFFIVFLNLIFEFKKKMEMNDEPTIKQGCFVIITRCGYSRLCPVVPGKRILLHKTAFYLDNLVGHSFGQYFEIVNKQLQVCSNTIPESVAFSNNLPDGLMSDTDSNSEEANGNLEENASNQMVSREELAEMKKKGTSSDEIIRTLVKGSLSFKRKSTFAQSKYVQRKKLKHSEYVLVLKPTIRLLADVFYAKNPEKMQYLRQDAFAMLLAKSNIYPGARVLLVEDCCGLISAAIVEKMNGDGICMQIHRGDQCQSKPCLDAMDFPKNILQTFQPIPISLAIKENENEDNETSIFIKCEQKLQEFEKGEFDSLIIASRFDPRILSEKLLSKIKLSGTIVIYSTCIQVLLECFQKLRSSNQVLNLEIMDTFMRYYQILPNRTRPEMNGHVSCGYLLSGIVAE